VRPSKEKCNKFKKRNNINIVGVDMTENRINVETSPTFIGFLPKHIRSFIPVILIGLLIFLGSRYEINSYLFNTISLVVIVGGLVLSWVKWWKESTISYILMAILAILSIYTGRYEWSDFFPFDMDALNLLLKIGIVSSLIVVLYNELFRATIKYRITIKGVEISGGIFRKRTRMIVADSINDVIVKKMPIFNVGTIVLTTASGLSLQEDIRSAGVGKETKGGFIGGIMYSRARKSESDDPLNVLYGIPNPDEIKEIVYRISALDRELALKQTELLEEIKENTQGEKE